MRTRIFLSIVYCLCCLLITVFAQTLTFTNLTYNRGTFYATTQIAVSDVNGDAKADQPGEAPATVK